jgi:dTDP-4-dehydrorhamnose reductase
MSRFSPKLNKISSARARGLFGGRFLRKRLPRPRFHRDDRFIEAVKSAKVHKMIPGIGAPCGQVHAETGVIREEVNPLAPRKSLNGLLKAEDRERAQQAANIQNHIREFPALPHDRLRNLYTVSGRATPGVRHRKTVIVTGSGGQLGRAILRCPAFADAEVIGLDRARLDVTDDDNLQHYLSTLRPDWVIHAAAITAVDACEDDPLSAYRVNAFGTQSVARACAQTSANLIVVSSDYVFSGTSARPMEVWDAPCPLSEYGRSKRAGESLSLAEWERVWVVRTSYLFMGKGPSLMSRLLERALSGKALRLVSDQTVVPTFAPDAAESLADLVRQEPPPGIYHIAGSVPGTPLEIGAALLKATGIAVPVETVRLEQVALKAARPKYSVLSCARAASCEILLPRGWPDTLGLFLTLFED